MVRKAQEHVLTKRRIIIRWVIIGIIGLGIALFLLAPLTQSLILKTLLSSRSNTALSNSRSSFTDTVNSRIDAARQKLELPASTYSTIYNTCYTDHTDSGWFATSYNYNCTLGSFTFFEVPEESSLMKDIKEHAERGANRYGGDSTLSSYYGELYLLDASIIKSSSQPLSDPILPYQIAIIKPNTYTSVQDALAVRAIDSSNIVAYAASQAFANRQLQEQHGTQSLDRQKTYIVLQHSDKYFSQAIGCRIPNIIFCGSPM